MADDYQQRQQRRAALLEQSTQRRAELLQEWGAWRGNLQRIDASFSLLKSLSRQPMVMLGLSALIVWLKPQRALHQVKAGLSLFESANKVLPLLLPLLQSLLAGLRKR
ncbi:YqjK family protein [Massilia sp. W12]|uniref:YqjK family protein n=1 Tax=Massilia sp. W12 TaxID=3126507 RepID=UPI0030D2DFBE